MYASQTKAAAKYTSLILFSKPYTHVLTLRSKGISHKRPISATFAVRHVTVNQVRVCVCSGGGRVCESWCTMKAAWGLQQAKALTSLIKQSHGGRSVKCSWCHQSSWQNWSLVNSSSQFACLCSPLRRSYNAEKGMRTKGRFIFNVNVSASVLHYLKWTLFLFQDFWSRTVIGSQESAQTLLVFPLLPVNHAH